MALLASVRIRRCTAAGSLAWKEGSTALTASATCTVFWPGCFSTESEMDCALVLAVKNQAESWVFSTLSTSLAMSARRTGCPLRTATTTAP